MEDRRPAALRPSTSNPSLRPISNFSASSRTGSYRHALLKPHPNHHSIEKEILPVPPLLTHESFVLTERDQAQHNLGEGSDSRHTRVHIHDHYRPAINLRSSSKNACLVEEPSTQSSSPRQHRNVCEIRRQSLSICSLDGSTSEDMAELPNQNVVAVNRNKQQKRESNHLRGLSLKNLSHISLGEGQHFSLGRSVKRQSTTARDWSPARKGIIAITACISTAMIGILVGLYAGLVPSIQYYIADFNHYAILGNVVLYLGMALPVLLLWPLPLLHGRKPYIMSSLCLAMPLLFPQAIAIGVPRSPNTPVWRVALLLPRALMGFVLGFASMNFHSMLTDLYGASLMSRSPHQEVVDDFDARRHGGGLGVWLGIWTWCHIGSLSLGFVIGAVMIEYLNPSWGLYTCIALLAAVAVLNVLCPEVRTGTTFSRRLARGEVMMHRVQNGPRWWGQEVYHGVLLSLEMLRQPGFLVMAVYWAWIYAQVVLIIVLLGSLVSKSYRYRSPIVAACVSSVAIGALIAIPFQKANLFSRARNTAPLSNSMTFDKRLVWSSHLIRRATFVLILPLAGIVYTFLSPGPPVHVFFPSFFAGLMGFLSCLAISECAGLLMETWDCSDLQPGMTGRSMSNNGEQKRINYSSFPRVTAGWNVIQGLGFIFAAGATGVGGRATRVLSQREATGIVAGILLVLSLLLLGTFLRFKKVQIIPNCSCQEMERWMQERRVSLSHRAAMIATAKARGNKDLGRISEDNIGNKPAILATEVFVTDTVMKTMILNSSVPHAHRMARRLVHKIIMITVMEMIAGLKIDLTTDSICKKTKERLPQVSTWANLSVVKSADSRSFNRAIWAK
ncbi:hypothetical protein F5Y16DRAFT_407423 [Xylariaceae sp. FL0255]|nr:hypothetical protein F5Y16DRAFT_407423 [Xylariaceae sp. FL0255]